MKKTFCNDCLTFFGKWGVFDKDGHQILPSQWDDVSLFCDSIILASITKLEPTSSYYSSSDLVRSYSLFKFDGIRVGPEEFNNIKKCPYIFCKDHYNKNIKIAN